MKKRELKNEQLIVFLNIKGSSCMLESMYTNDR